MKKIVAIVLLLLGIWYLQARFLRSQDEKHASVSSLDIAGDSSSIVRMVISDTNSQLGMQKRDSIWFLEGTKPLGDERAKASDALDLAKLVDPLSLELVSQNPDKQETLGISDNQALKVAFFNDITAQAPVSELLVSAKDKTLVRSKGSNDVYSWPLADSRLITTNFDTWLEASSAATPTQKP